MQSATSDTTGCQVTASEWNIISSGGAITPDTILNAGDIICQTLTLTALDGYEFGATNVNPDFGTADFSGTVTFNGRSANLGVDFSPLRESLYVSHSYGPSAKGSISDCECNITSFVKEGPFYLSVRIFTMKLRQNISIRWMGMIHN